MHLRAKSPFPFSRNKIIFTPQLRSSLGITTSPKPESLFLLIMFSLGGTNNELINPNHILILLPLGFSTAEKCYPSVLRCIF